MRDPSLHLTQSQLTELLKDTLNLTEQKALILAKKLIKKAYSVRVKGRTQIVEKDKATNKKLKRTIAADNDYTPQFNKVLTLIRMNQGHNFTGIKDTDREYVTLKEITIIALDFCKSFKLDIDAGFKLFVQIGLYFIGKKYAINKFKTHKENIFNFYSFSVEIDNDPNKEATNQFYEAWKETMLTWADLEMEVKNVDKFINILYGRQEADEAKADYKDWIEAQFCELAWLDVIPELTQLHGVNALERYERWKVKNRKEKAEETETFSTPAESYLSKIRK